MTEAKKSVSVIKSYSIDKPAEMSKMANVLKAYVVKNKLYTPIVGKNYAHVEGWQFAGGMMGLFPRVASVEKLSEGNELKWQAEVEIVDKEDRIVSRGFAICSNKESKKKNFDEYAILSMAQTRAIGKAYRNLIGWVMKLAGYEGTPSEEMTKMGETPKEPQNTPTAQNQAIPTPKKGQVPGPDGLPTYVCSKCGDPIAEVVADYSQKVYGKKLCKDCQPKKK